MDSAQPVVTSQPRLRKAALSLFRKPEIRGSLEELVEFLCQGIDKSAFKWKTRESVYTIAHTDTSYRASLLAHLYLTQAVSSRPRRNILPVVSLEVSFDVSPASAWLVRARLLDKGGAELAPWQQFWRYEPFDGDLWPHNFDLQLLKEAGLLDNWENHALREAIELISKLKGPRAGSTSAKPPPAPSKPVTEHR